MHKIVIATFTALAIGGGTDIADGASAQAQEVRIFKTPECGCCEAYADHLRANGFTVTVQPTEDLAAMSREAGIPDDFQGCHLGFVDGYVVSGHVPVSAVNRLLSERPDIDGVTLPGMPAGSPGMGGAKTEPFTIYTFGDERPAIYAVE